MRLLLVQSITSAVPAVVLAGDHRIETVPEMPLIYLAKDSLRRRAR
jgi:hypothetical protein